MSIKLGGSASKTKTTSNSTSNSTTTPIMPGWAPPLAEGVAGRVSGLMGLDPQSLVAPSHALQNQAAAGAASLGSWRGAAAPGMPSGGDDTNWLAPHMNAATPFASGGKAYDYVDRYVNPYLKDVVDSSASDFDAHAGNVRAQQALNLAGSGAFGGSGAALTQSMTEGELARGRASTLSGLRSRAYEQALGAAAGDAERATQARIANAQTALQDRAQKTGLGFEAQQQMLAADANRRGNIATQVEVGGALRGVDQQQRQASIENTEQLVAMLSGLPIGLFTGQQKTGTESNVGTTKTKGMELEASHDFSKQLGWA